MYVIFRIEETSSDTRNGFAAEKPAAGRTFLTGWVRTNPALLEEYIYSERSEGGEHGRRTIIR